MQIESFLVRHINQKYHNPLSTVTTGKLLDASYNRNWTLTHGALLFFWELFLDCCIHFFSFYRCWRVILSLLTGGRHRPCLYYTCRSKSTILSTSVILPHWLNKRTTGGVLFYMDQSLPSKLYLWCLIIKKNKTWLLMWLETQVVLLVPELTQD